MDVGELVQGGQAAWGNAISLLALLTTILSGYLVVAYMAGKDMARSQVIIVNILYVLLFVVTITSTLIFVKKASELMLIAFELSNHRIAPPLAPVGYVLVIVYLFGLVASLKFMWDIRHKAREQ